MAICTGSQVRRSAIQQVREVLKSFREFQRVPESSRKFQKVPESSREFQRNQFQCSSVPVAALFRADALSFTWRTRTRLVQDRYTGPTPIYEENEKRFATCIDCFPPVLLVAAKKSQARDSQKIKVC